MHTIQFLDKVLGNTGKYCLFMTQKRTDGGNKRKQLFFDSVPKLAAYANLHRNNNVNIYFALATFGNERRLASNVNQMRSFYLDLDCGSGKPFKDQTDALTQLKAFMERNKLPRPIIINSGYGIHCYWALEEPIGLEAWKETALHLKKLCNDQGFEADNSVTADAARVLRMPDTFNVKYDVAVKCHILPDKRGMNQITHLAFNNLLKVPDVPEPTLAVAETAKRFLESNDRLIGNKEAVFKTIAQKSLKTDKGCAQIKHRIVNQANMSEPEWRGVLSIAQFCSDRDTAIHKVSSKHPQYNYNETEEKANAIPKPHLCESLRLDSDTPSLCDGCPHRGKIKSPISLGMQVKEAEIEDGVYKVDPLPEGMFSPTPATPKELTLPIPAFPFPYKRGKNGGIYLTEIDIDDEGNKTTNDILIYRNDLYPIQRVYDRGDGEKIVLRLHLPKDGVREFGIPIPFIASINSLRDELSKMGVMVSNFTNLQRYFMRWLEELQESKSADEAHNQFGWTNKRLDGFVLGNRKITPAGVMYNAPHSQTMGLIPAFEPAGTLEGWKETVSMWNDDKFVLQQYGLCMSFGSVLMELANVNSAGVHFYSKESGVGKTAILQAIASVWGNPEELIIAKEDTVAFKMLRAEVYHNLPLPIDEITNLSAEEASNLIYQLSSGRQRGRLTGQANVERERGREWSLMAATTGNTSILQIINAQKSSPTAEAQRMLECRVKRIFDKTKDKGTTDAFNKGLEENYGHAGAIFVDYVMKDPDGIKTLASEIVTRVDKDAGLTSENRFWSAQVAYTITGGMIAHRLGLIGFDLSNIYNWAISVLLQGNINSAVMEVQTVEDIISEFYNEHLGDIIVIDSGGGDSVTAQLGGEPLQQVQRDPKMRLKGRYEPDTNTLSIHKKAFTNWCASRQMDSAAFAEEMKLSKDIEFTPARSVRLGTGTTLSGLPATRCMVIRFKDVNSGLFKGE